MTTEKKDITWINIAKFIAILAVLTDHSEMILYDNPSIAIATYFSVTVFVFVSGMMTYGSIKRHDLPYMSFLKRSLMKVIPGYLAVVFIYMLVMSGGHFDFKTYLDSVISFNVSAHFYYISVYIQLMLISVPLVRLMDRAGGVYTGVNELLIGLLILSFSIWSTNCTNIFYIYGGGGKLLGGTYLTVFYLGMLAYKHGWFKERGSIVYAVVSAVSCVGAFFWWRFECRDHYALDVRLHLGDGVNPPGVSTLVMAMLILALCYGLTNLLEDHKVTSKLVHILSRAGRHTFYIFLYHRIVLDRLLVPYVRISGIWIRRAVFMTMMIVIPIAVESCFGYVKKSIESPALY